jgi:succinyl-CoA synthetase beta subunit
MDLLEYQAKDLFQRAGIPVLPSQCIERPSDLKDVHIPYPLVLKSQVRKGGRGPAGGVRFADNTIDAIAAAQAIFGLPINGEFPAVLLAEVQYHTANEFYLAIAIDPQARRPMLLGSVYGGSALESNPDSIQQVVVADTFSPYYARRLAVQMGLHGELLQSVADIVERMYWLFSGFDLDLVEINPLGVSFDGEVMALDGWIRANAQSLDRHPELTALNRTPTRGFDPSAAAHAAGMQWFDLTAMPTAAERIGLLANGPGLTLAALDELQQANHTAVCALDVGNHPTAEGIEKGLALLSRATPLDIVLVNILGSATTCEAAAIALVKHLYRTGAHTLPNGDLRPRFAVRMLGCSLDSLQSNLADVDISVQTNLVSALQLPQQQPFEKTDSPPTPTPPVAPVPTSSIATLAR